MMTANELFIFQVNCHKSHIIGCIIQTTQAQGKYQMNYQTQKGFASCNRATLFRGLILKAKETKLENMYYSYSNNIGYV